MFELIDENLHQLVKRQFPLDDVQVSSTIPKDEKNARKIMEITVVKNENFKNGK